MTDYERQLDPYYDKLLEEEKGRRRWMRPLQMVFDVLQRGQYVSANIAEELADLLDKNPNTQAQFGQAILEGLTGKRKGSYETFIRDRLNTGQTKLFKNAPEGTRRAQWDWADVLGLIGDIALDPTTYMSFGLVGGSTKAAKAASSTFADDAVRLMLRKLADQPDDIVRRMIGQGGKEAIDRALAVGSNRGLRKLAGAGGDFGRFIDQAYRSAQKQALNRTQSELLQFMGRESAGLLDDAAGTGLEALSRGLDTGARYAGAGERSARFLGKEFGKRTGTRAGVTQGSWEKFQRLFTQADPSKPSLRNAIWGVMNRGPIGEMRRALGFRNPYQKYLRAQQLDHGIEMSRVAGTDALKEGFAGISNLSDDQMTGVLNLLSQREAAEKAMREQVAGGGMAITATVPEVISSGDAVVDEAANKLGSTLDKWFFEESYWSKQLGETPAEYRKWYAPEFFRDTTSGPNVRAGRQYTFRESFDREVATMRTMWGVDDATARQAVSENLSGFSMDLKTNLANRAMVHGRAKARWELLTQLKEFGVDLRRAGDDPVAEALTRSGRDLTALGLKNVDHDFFRGVVFDQDVADIIQRSLDVTGRDLNVFQRGMKKFANWWKSIVTMTTGFHARNHISNTVTQYLHHGPRAFNFDEYMMSVAAVASTLRENSRKAFLGDLGVEPQWMEKYLNRRVGNMTVRELAERARREGVISEATMGFDAPDIVKNITGKQGQPLRSASRGLGNYIENIPRFQSFLIDYSDLATNPQTLGDLAGRELTGAIANADESALKYASREAKKWFIDYQDLCFDTETEILTNHGWRNIDTITYRDEVLSFSIERDRLEWKPVDYIHRAGYNGKMYRLSNTAFDAVVTPRHRWVRIGGLKGGHHSISKKPYTIEETKDLVTRNTRLKITSSNYAAPEKETFSTDFVELCAWALAEGTYPKNGRSVTIYQSHKHNPEYCDQLTELFGRLENRGSLSIRPHNKDITAFYVGNGIGEKIRDWLPDKRLTIEFLLLLTKEQLEVMYKTLLLGDGHRIEYASGGEHWVFSQKDPEFVAAFQALAMLLGRRTVARKVEDYYQIGCHKKDVNLYTEALNVEQEHYSGRIWCVHSENNTVVARRGGTIYISGNTDFEQNTMKNVVPFYTWLRHNLSNQISGIALYPDLYSTIPKIQEFFQYEDPDYDPALIQDWIGDRGGFPVRREEDGTMRMTAMDFAHTALNLIPLQWEEGRFFPHWNGEDLKDELINSTAPWLRRMADVMIRGDNPYDFFYQQELEPTAPAPYLMRLFASQPGTVAAIDGFLRMVGLENGAHLDEQDGKLRIDSRMAVVLEDFLPVLRQMAFLLYLPQTVIPGLEETIEGFTGAQDDYEGAQQALQMLSYYLGIKLSDQDLEAEKAKLGRDIYYRSTEALQADRENSPYRVQERLQSARERDERIRRLGG